MRFYLIGSLRNPEVPLLATKLRSLGFDCFDDWYAAGPEADDYWKKYEIERGHDLIKALDGHAARHVFEYDRRHLDESDAAILMLPAGRSSHLELGYIIGQGKPGYILLDNDAKMEARFDVMYKFATKVYGCDETMLYELRRQYAEGREGVPCAATAGSTL